MKENIVNLGLFGFGTIGAGVVRLLDANADVIEEKTGSKLALKKIVDIDTETDRGVELPEGVLSADAADIIDNDDIGIVIELIGGAGVAREIVANALQKGKHVVTANKELIAKHGPELVRLAGQNGVRILFEASVGGGIPVLTPLLGCLRGNRINRVLGIVNGTTNYILTQMEATGADFDVILKEAQELGYAEADPTNDIEGFDAAYKAVILASAAFGKKVDVSSIMREGITKVGMADMEYARELGYTIKLLAVLEDNGAAVDVRVHPCLLPCSHPLASINGVLNAVYLEGDPIGPLMFVGQGAGPSATSSAVIGDVLELLTSGTSAAGGTAWNIFADSELAPVTSVSNAFYMRLTVSDMPGVLADVGGCLGRLDVSLASVVQKKTDGKSAELVMLTHSVNEGNMAKALEQLKDLKCVETISTALRVFDS